MPKDSAPALGGQSEAGAAAGAPGPEPLGPREGDGCGGAGWLSPWTGTSFSRALCCHYLGVSLVAAPWPWCVLVLSTPAGSDRLVYRPPPHPLHLALWADGMAAKVG